MDNKGRDELTTMTRKKGILYFIKKLFNFLPVETVIKTSSGVYDVEIKISQRKMKKMVDEICLSTISSL